MSKTVLLLLFQLAVCSGYGQHYQKWIFGNGAGLDFSSYPPAPMIKSALRVNFDTLVSAVCNSKGELQFYTDGHEVYTAGGKKLAQQDGKWPWSGRTVPLLIPVQNSETRYYLFGVSTEKYANKLQYLYLSADQGGQIEYPATGGNNYFTRLQDSCSTMLAATLHCNTKDTWVVTLKDNTVLAFLIDANGVSTNPVRSSIPSEIFPGGLRLDPPNIKFSSNGEKLILPAGTDAVLIADFDDLTGQCSNPYTVHLPEGHTLEELEISPDGTKLYIGSVYIDNSIEEVQREFHSVFQMDLNAGDPTSIEATWIKLHAFADVFSCTRYRCFYVHRAMAQGPDGKIYVGMRDEKTVLTVIESPNQPGLLSRYNKLGIKMGTEYKFMGVNTIHSTAANQQQDGIVARHSVCRGEPVQFSLLYKNVTGVRWDFGDPATGSANFSSDLAPSHRYADTGWFTITAILTRRCSTDTALYQLHLTDLEAVSFGQPDLDTTICKTQQLTIKPLASSASAYRWQDSDRDDPARTINKPGTYELVASNDCSVKSYFVTLHMEECPCNFDIPNAFSPNEDGRNDHFKPAGVCIGTHFEMQIYNRYGQQLYISRDPSRGWDGSWNGMPQQEGVYIYTITYKNPNTYTVYHKKGTVFLVR